MDYDILLKNARVWTGEKFLPGVQFVAVADGKIAEIGECPGKATYTVDVKGHILSPGLIDSHVHIRGCSPDSFAIGMEAAGFPFGVTAAVEASASLPEGSRILDNMLMKTYVFVAAQFAGKTFLEVGRSADLCVLKYGAMPFKISSGGGAVTQSELGYVNLLTLCRGTVMFRSLQNEI